MEEVYLPPASQKALIALSRQMLECFVRGREKQVAKIEDQHLLTPRYGAFVSLHKGRELRGCIGTCFPRHSLYATVIEMTEAAASRDHRVRPISESELSDIQIDISVLSPLEAVADPLSLEIGKHGLHVTRGEKRGVLLPQVASEYGWDIRTFLCEACLKAGLAKNAWQTRETKVSSFTALVIEEEER